jgi:hypothetical protein
MKKIYLVLLATALFTSVSFSQKGNNQIGVGADISFPIGDFGDAFKTGFGGYVKGMYGVGTAGQVTLTTGYSSFKAKGSNDILKMTINVLPVLAGYRHYFSGLFAEPQIGYGNYTAKIKGEDEDLEIDGKDSEGSFTWAIGGGYVFNEKLEVSVRYQSANRNDSNLGLFGLRVGYNFSLRKK